MLPRKFSTNPCDGLLVFLYAGGVEIDSDFVENRIRPLQSTLKHALFADLGGAAADARIGLPVEACKVNDFESDAWPMGTFELMAACHGTRDRKSTSCFRESSGLHRTDTPTHAARRKPLLVNSDDALHSQDQAHG